MSLQFLSLASGSSGNCYYLGNEEYGILIDAGKGVRTIKKVLKEYGIPFEKIVALCITHDHADHIKAAGTLGEKYGIPIYTTEAIKNGMNRNYCMVDKIYSAHRPIVKEIPFKIKDFTITAFEVPHDGSDNVGFLFLTGICILLLRPIWGISRLRQINICGKLIIWSSNRITMRRCCVTVLILFICRDVSLPIAAIWTMPVRPNIWLESIRRLCEIFFYVISAGITITLNWLIRRWKTDFTRKAYEWVKMWSWWHLPVITRRSFIRLKSRKEWIGTVRFREKMTVLDSRIVCRSVKNSGCEKFF